MSKNGTAMLLQICQAGAFLAALLTALGSMPAAAQTLPWGWGNTQQPTANGSHDLFADYLLTGQKPLPAVVRIVAPESSGVSLGSGVLVDVNQTQALVLTNWHVIRDCRSAVLVQFPDGFQSAGTVVRWDEAWDLAALVIWKPPTVPISLAANPPSIGDSLTIAGYGRGPFRAETGQCTEYLSPGTGYPKEFVEIAATARQGDSGGPILNQRGELAGVLFGQSEGRTIGSCSTRVRTFLASVGSQGFTAIPLAAFSNTSALDSGVGMSASAPTRLTAAALDSPVQRSMHVEGPAPPEPSVFNSLGVFAGMPLDSGTAGTSGGIAATARAPVRLAEVFDIFTNGRALLVAAGGLALALLGLRTICVGRS